LDGNVFKNVEQINYKKFYFNFYSEIGLCELRFLLKLNSRTVPQEPLRMLVLKILTISSESFLHIGLHGERSTRNLSLIT